MIDTNESLLGRLKNENAHTAWRDFYDAYWSAIVRYARKLGLDATEAEEVLQETMVALMRAMRDFVYDRRKGLFRNFLLTIVHRRSLQALARRRRQRLISLESEDLDGQRLGERSAGEDLSGGEEAEAVHRWRQSILDDSLARLRTDDSIDPRTRSVFEAYVIEQRPAPEVAVAFGVNENAVYQIKNRLTRRLRIDAERRMRESGSTDE